jgi:hypothetical protein
MFMKTNPYNFCISVPSCPPKYRNAGRRRAARRYLLVAFCFMICGFFSFSFAGDCPKTLRAYLGETPVLDGVVSPGEWDDAMQAEGLEEWNFEENEPISDSTELSLRVMVKHDGVNLYFVFDALDDQIYGFDTERWLPDGNPNVHELNQQGWPWFGDGGEIMLNPSNSWNGTEHAAGDATSWQLIMSTHKSLLGGLDSGGMSGGEPRSDDQAWANCTQWIGDSAIYAAVRIKPEEEGRGWTAEWKISPDPLLMVEEGIYWEPGMGEVSMGLQLEIQDVDTKEEGTAWSNMRHIGVWACTPKLELQSWGTLILDPERNPEYTSVRFHDLTSPLSKNSPACRVFTLNGRYLFKHSLTGAGLPGWYLSPPGSENAAIYILK